MSLKIQQRDPQHLSVHPALKHIPSLSEEALKPFRTAMQMDGERLETIPVDEEGRILTDSGRSAWLCAKARQLPEVTVCIRPAALVHLLVIRDLAHRRHLSKSAIAYLVVPHLDGSFNAARMAKLEKLRKNPENAVVASGHYEPETVEELATELGVDRKTLFEARKVRKEFENAKKYTWQVKGGGQDGAVVEMTFKEWFEPKLLRSFQGGEHEENRPIGLGGIIAGIEAKKKNPEDFNPKKNDQLELFERRVDFVGGWAYFQKLSDKDRARHFDNFADRLELIPDEQREALADYFEKLAKRVRKSISTEEK